MARIEPQRHGGKKWCSEFTSTERGNSREGQKLQCNVVLVLYFAQKIKKILLRKAGLWTEN